ncbi:hypothetical protein [Ectobacillus funiculus]|uniref:Uncharacterized protein n=1 Tax=Ectobacillus funiculus TaxID=137993 RepID=A0ABV5WLT8_9BACI
MSMCPVCNGLTEIPHSCPNCAVSMEDCGKTVDYLGPYSAYMDQQLLEKVDGLAHEESNRYCLHLYHCPACERDCSVKVQQI